MEFKAGGQFNIEVDGRSMAGEHIYIEYMSIDENRACGLFRCLSAVDDGAWERIFTKEPLKVRVEDHKIVVEKIEGVKMEDD